jgi:hypothetical protein
VWTRDGTIIFTRSVTDGLWRVPESGGTPERFTELAADERSHRWPALLLDGTAVLFTIQPQEGEFDDAPIAVKSLVTGEQKIIARGGSNPMHAAGYLVYGRAGSLMAVPFDAGRLEAPSAPVRVLEGVSGVRGSGAVQFALSSTGSLAYLSGEVRDVNRPLLWVNRRGESQPALAVPRRFLEASLSPDGRHLAASIAAPGGNPDVWVFETATGAATKLTFSPGSEIGVAWTPDGQYVTYRVVNAGTPQLVRKRFDGDGVEELVVADKEVYPPLTGAWHKSAEWITYSARDIFVAPASAGRKPAVFAGTPAVELFPAFSPDGRWLAYQSNQTGQFEIYVQPFPQTGAWWQVSTEGGERALWSRSGPELYFRSADRMMAVRVTPGATFKSSGPYPVVNSMSGTAVDVAADGRFLTIGQVTPAGLSQLRFVLNWREEVRSLVTVR